MSEVNADTKTASKNRDLPNFMNENSKAGYAELEENPSWLNNNLHKLMVGISALWFAIVMIYITQFFGWSNLFLMMPDEFGGFLAGITLPLAIIWVVMAYIDRGTSFKQEAKFLRAYMNQLVYPEQGAPQTAKAMADAIRSQVIELQQVSKMATDQSARIKDEIAANVKDFSKIMASLDTYSSKTIVELSDGVKFLVKNFEAISSKAEDSAKTFYGYNQQFSANAQDIEKSIDSLFEKLLPRIKEIKSSAQLLKEITDNSNHNILRTNELMMQFNDEANTNLTKVGETLTNQTALLQKVSQNAIENCGLIQKTVGSEVENLGNIINTQVQRMETAVAKHNDYLQNQISIFTDKAAEGCAAINQALEKEVSGFNQTVNDQVAKVDSMIDEQTRNLLENVNKIDDKADTVSAKLANYGSSLAQEIDKLMVRSNNLEESIAIQVRELSNVADKIAASMRQADDSITSGISTLHSQTAAANADLDDYFTNLQGRTAELGEMASDVLQRSTMIADEIVARHNNLNEAIQDISARMAELNARIDAANENIQEQARSSAAQITMVGEAMNKHAVGLTEASSIVVSQSQVSEAALAQQERNITNSANRVEAIKAELKRQIEELSQASAILAGDASAAVDKIQNQINVMMESCQKVIAESTAINDNLAEQSTQFDTSANKTLTKVARLEEVLTAQSANMEALSGAISARAGEVDNILSRQSREIDKATGLSQTVLERLTAAFEKQNVSLTEIARDTAGYVSETVRMLDDKAEALNLLFKHQENEFFNMCDKIADNTNAMRKKKKKQIAVIEQSADKVFSRMVLLEEDTGKHTEAVVANSHRSIDKLAEIERTLGEKNEMVGALVDNVAKSFNKIADQVQDKVNVFDTTVNVIKDQTTGAVKTILDNCSKLQSANQNLAAETSNVSKLMDEHVKSIDVTLLKTKVQADDIKQTLEQQRDHLSDVANTVAAQTRLGEASLAQQYKYLSDAATKVSQQIKEINDGFKTGTDGIFETANKLAYEFDVLGDRLIKAGEDVAKTSKNSMKSLEQVNMSLSQCSDDLDATINNSVTNIGGVFKDYEKYIAGFNTVTAETSTGVIEINNLISEQSDKMVKISEDTKKLVECFNTVLNDTSMSLSERANAAYDKVKDLGNSLKNLSLQMEDAAKLSATHFENSGDKLRAAIAEISANAERISNEIRSSGEVFLKQSDVLVATTDDTVGKIHQAMTEILNSNEEFAAKGDNIIAQSLRFNDLIAAQIKQLNENTAKADKVLQNLTKSYQGIQAEAFLADAGSIIEKLETISVDINRIFNPKDEEDLWKKFYNGDTGVFVRYLSKNMDKKQVLAIRSKYEKDGDFRMLVNSYLGEFEGLVARAKASERSGVLLAIVSGADIGKLYYVLAKTLDKLN